MPRLSRVRTELFHLLVIPLLAHHPGDGVGPVAGQARAGVRRNETDHAVLLRARVITISAGSYGNVIRLLMPLVITDAQMDEALDVLEGAFKAVYERKQEADRATGVS